MEEATPFPANAALIAAGVHTIEASVTCALQKTVACTTVSSNVSACVVTKSARLLGIPRLHIGDKAPIWTMLSDAGMGGCSNWNSGSCFWDDNGSMDRLPLLTNMITPNGAWAEHLQML